jgi:hypothetical protein
LVGISTIFNIKISDLIDKMVLYLEKDKYDKCYTYLNNGNLSIIFKSKEDYINYIKTSSNLGSQLLQLEKLIPHDDLENLDTNLTNGYPHL